MKPIAIDLRNLTPAHLEAAKPHMGKCVYYAPCIIGSLIEPEKRQELHERIRSMPHTSVSALHQAGVFTIPAYQLGDARDLQYYFDNRMWSRVEEIASRYINAKETIDAE
jgi:hypothetical protein